jgi:hypothetical protein
MPGSVAEVSVEGVPPISATRLMRAVLCVDCDAVSDSPHDYCIVCGSRKGHQGKATVFTVVSFGFPKGRTSKTSKQIRDRP